MPQAKFSFSYTPLRGQDQRTGKAIVIYRPLVPVEISFEERKSPAVNALIDSGADENLFPAWMGVIAGIDIRRGTKQHLIGIGRFEIETYKCRVKLNLLTAKPISFETNVSFSYEQQMPILGRSGFFDLFKKVEFSERKKIVELIR